MVSKKYFYVFISTYYFYYSINPKMLISSLRYLTGSYSHFNIYIANFTMYSLKCHTEDVRGVREDVGRKERIKKESRLNLFSINQIFFIQLSRYFVGLFQHYNSNTIILIYNNIY